jgi:hypothetical protein
LVINLWSLFIAKSTVKNFPRVLIEINLIIIPVMINNNPIYGKNSDFIIGHNKLILLVIPNEIEIIIVIQISLRDDLSQFFELIDFERSNLFNKISDKNQHIHVISKMYLICPVLTYTL